MVLVLSKSLKIHYEIGALVNNELTELSGITGWRYSSSWTLADDINTIIVKMQTISASEPKEENV